MIDISSTSHASTLVFIFQFLGRHKATSYNKACATIDIDFKLCVMINYSINSSYNICFLFYIHAPFWPSTEKQWRPQDTEYLWFHYWRQRPVWCQLSAQPTQITITKGLISLYHQYQLFLYLDLTKAVYKVTLPYFPFLFPFFFSILNLLII